MSWWRWRVIRWMTWTQRTRVWNVCNLVRYLFTSLVLKSTYQISSPLFSLPSWTSLELVPWQDSKIVGRSRSSSSRFNDQIIFHGKDTYALSSIRFPILHQFVRKISRTRETDNFRSILHSLSYLTFEKVRFLYDSIDVTISLSLFLF